LRERLTVGRFYGGLQPGGEVRTRMVVFLGD
jgi:hypothetical protein